MPGGAETACLIQCKERLSWLMRTHLCGLTALLVVFLLHLLCRGRVDQVLQHWPSDEVSSDVLL
jgi:hypothetical protein